MKKLLIILMAIQSQAYAYYDAAADYSHGAQSYDEYVLGAPIQSVHEAPDFLTPRIIHFSDNIRQNGQANMYEEGKSETRKVIFKDRKMEIK